MKIILASASPRRQELLAGLDIDFTVNTLPDLDESFPDTLTGEEIPLYIARSKAEAYKQLIEPDQLVITADTIVWINDEVLGKPADEKEAVEMLQKLSGNMHEVITGVCLTTQQWQKSFAVTTQVTFDTLSNEEINYYVQKYKPMDKAGAYGVQEWIGYIGVAKLTGSYFNVMGLPVQRLYRELVELKVLGR